MRLAHDGDWLVAASRTSLAAPPATTPAPKARPAWAEPSWCLLPPLLVGALGGWAVSRHHGLWFDEVYTAQIAPLPLGDLLSAIVRGEGPIPYLRDAPPSYNGPYYAVVHLWLAATGLQADEWGLRLLSLLATVAAVLAFTAAVRHLAGAGVALAAGLVAASNPFVVEYSAEGRGYGLALLGVALAGLGLARWLDGRPRALLLYGVAAAGAGLAHWFALLVVAAFVVAAFVVAALVLDRRRAAPLVVVSALSTVPALALVVTAAANGVGASGAEWLRGVGPGVPWLVLRSWAGGNAPLVVLSLVLGATGMVRARRDHWVARVVATAWFGVPVVAVALLEVVRPVFVDRYLLAAVLGLALLIAVGAASLPRRAAVLAVATVVATSMWATSVDVGRGPKQDVRGAVSYLASRHRPGEPVVAGARWDALGVDHFTRRDHPVLVSDVVLAPPRVPQAPSLWVIRRSHGGIKGDGTRLTALDSELAAQGMRLDEERRFDGRYTDTLVQRWVRER